MGGLSESGAQSGALSGKTVSVDATEHQVTVAEQGDPLAKLAAALLTLSPADRERLVAMLTGHRGNTEGKTP
jgi:hypothetical protein